MRFRKLSVSAALKRTIASMSVSDSKYVFQKPLSSRSEPLRATESHCRATRKKVREVSKTHRGPLRATQKSRSLFQIPCSRVTGELHSSIFAVNLFSLSYMTLCGWVRGGPDCSNIKRSCISCDLQGRSLILHFSRRTRRLKKISEGFRIALPPVAPPCTKRAAMTMSSQSQSVAKRNKACRQEGALHVVRVTV